jgi:hypothetical protein
MARTRDKKDDDASIPFSLSPLGTALLSLQAA